MGLMRSLALARALPEFVSDRTQKSPDRGKDPGEAVETWRQGEFTAGVHLTATGDTAVTGTFAARIPDSVGIVGAYGAAKR